MDSDGSVIGYILFALMLSPVFIIVALCLPIKFRGAVLGAMAAFVIYTQIDHRSWEDKPVAQVTYLDLTKVETNPELCHYKRSELWTPGYDQRTHAQQIIEDEELKRNITNMAVFEGQIPREVACTIKEKIAYFDAVIARALPPPSYIPANDAAAQKQLVCQESQLRTDETYAQHEAYCHQGG